MSEINNTNDQQEPAASEQELLLPFALPVEYDQEDGIIYDANLTAIAELDSVRCTDPDIDAEGVARVRVLIDQTGKFIAAAINARVETRAQGL